MEKSEFISIRKKLGKTQQELSELLASSLKAVSSYEQGWRNIPGHVERQLFFLLAKKAGNNGKNCWDILKCPPHHKQSCPAWEFKSGNLCWFVGGTHCSQGTKKNWRDKIAVCRECQVFKHQVLTG